MGPVPIPPAPDQTTWHRISKRSLSGLMIGAASRLLYRLHQLDDE
jgi:hypothetical protein